MLTNEQKLTYIATAMETLNSRIDDVAVSDDDYDVRIFTVEEARTQAIDEIEGLLK